MPSPPLPHLGEGRPPQVICLNFQLSGTWYHLVPPGTWYLGEGQSPQVIWFTYQLIYFVNTIFRRKKLVLADHVPGTQDYSGMSFEGLRAALQILSEVHSLTKPLHCHYPYHEPLHYILSVYP